MTSFLTDYAKKNVEKLLDGALKELRYICCFTCIAKEFEEEKPWLEAERTTVAQRVKVAKRRGDDVQANAIFWEEEADKIIQEDTKTKQKCFFGLCPDCIWRYKRGKELANKKDQIKKLMEIGKELGIGLPAPLPDVDRYSSRHYISFKSRESKCKELLDALKDDNNYIVCLQGMGGTGKTTLAKEVGKKLKQSKQFTYIIDTTVSFSPNIKKIQDDIAGPLGLTFDGCSESDRPRKLWKGLTSGENILLILDDVWGDIDFEEIGIPYSDDHKGCRILVTTRNVLVCNKLECSKTIKLELLSQDDAWEMFKRHAGLTEISTKSLLDKGFKIANECQGLPIAIAVIASSLKGKQHQEEWDVALNSLQRHAPIHEIDDDVDDLVKIYECLKFSYDNMNDRKSKRLFLLCSAFPEDEEIHTERLVRLGIGAGLFGENYGKYEDARSQVVKSKKKLIDSCLLLEVDQKRVKMHDLVRDAAQRIANKEIQIINLNDKNQKAMVERENNIKYLLCEGMLTEVLSCKLDSSKLQILILRTYMLDIYCHDEKIKVPNSFFENISGLRVFDWFILSFGSVKINISFPQSFQSLKNIRSLLFYDVDLGDISFLENLQSLETFELDMCTINELPEGLAKLQNLILLKLKSCEIIRNNPFKVIEGCSSLEELYFISSFNDCCREISLPVLQRFILDDSWGIENDSVSKCVSLLHQENKHILSEKQLKERIQVVEVLGLRGIWWEWVNIIPEIVPMDHGMNDLIELRLSSISQLKCLIDTKHDNSQVTTVFSKLVVLELEDMESLRELCNGPISFDSLKSLEKLTIKRCNQLQRLFPCSLNLFNLKSLSLIQCPMLILSLFQLTTSRSLVSLEELKVIGWHLLQIGQRKENESGGEIVVDEENNDRKRSQDSIFPKLKNLYIQESPEFKFKFSALSIQDLPSLESFSVSGCEKLQCIFGHNIINNDLKCDHVVTSSPISRNASKPEQESDPMKCSTFSWTNISCFGKKSMTTARIEIPLVSEDQQQDLTTETTSFLVGPKNSFSLNYLTSIKIALCAKLEIVFFTSILRCLPQLRTLRIEECKELKHIIEDDLENEKSITFESTNTYFPKLEILVVLNCNKLKCVFQTSICKELPKLKVLIIKEAYELQEIFKIEGDDQKLEIPNLELVAFTNLPNLCHAQGMHFVAVESRLVQNCHKLSLTSTNSDAIDEIIGFVKDIDFIFYMDLKFLLQPPRPLWTPPYFQSLMHEQSTDQQYSLGETDTIIKPQLDGSTTPETTLAANSSTISETKMKPPTPFFLDPQQQLKMLQLMGQQLSTNQQRSLGETDTTIKPQLDGSTTPEKTLAANPSTISETKKEPPIQLVVPKQKSVKISAEEGITSTNVKTFTSSTHSKTNSSSSDPLSTSEFKPSPQKDRDCQIDTTSLSNGTTETNNEASLNADTSKKVSSNIEEQFPNDDKIIFSKSKPPPRISSPIGSQFSSIPCEGDLSQIIQDSSFHLLVTRELEQLVSKKHLDYENLSLLTDFLYKHPSVLLKDTSLSNRYKGYAYSCLAELLKFLQSHSVLDVLGSNHYEFVELLQDVRKCGFDKDWLDGIERRILFPNLKHQLTSSEAVLESIIQQKRVLSAPIGY